MRQQHELFGAHARVHGASYTNPHGLPQQRSQYTQQQAGLQSRQMYRRATMRSQAQVAAAAVQQRPQPAQQVQTPAPQASTAQKLDDFYFFYTFVENGRTYIVFKKYTFVVLLLVMSIGIGILALDFRRLFLFLARGCQASLAAVVS